MPKSPPPPRREGDVRLQGTRPGAMTRAMDAVAEAYDEVEVIRDGHDEEAVQAEPAKEAVAEL